MSYGRMKEKIPQLEEEIGQWFKQAESEDQGEDNKYGHDKRGDELPDWVANKQLRLEKMKEAKAALEAEQRDEDGPDEDPEPPRPGPKRKRPKGVPEDRAQRNFTDPHSRIMKGSDGFVQGYNAQAAVDAGSQVIVAHGLTNNGADNGQLLPMVNAIKATLGRYADEISADTGFLSEDNLRALKRTRSRAYIATGRHKHDAHASGTKSSKPLTRAMSLRIKRGGWRSRYRLRKQTVETGVRANQTRPRLPHVLAAWNAKGERGMGTCMHGAQSPQARHPGPLTPTPWPFPLTAHPHPHATLALASFSGRRAVGGVGGHAR
jgi:hypothetical protein